MPFLKIGVTFANFKQSGNLLFSKDSLKYLHIVSAKRSLFSLINLTGISLSWIAFEESNKGVKRSFDYNISSVFLSNGEYRIFSNKGSQRLFIFKLYGRCLLEGGT